MQNGDDTFSPRVPGSGHHLSTRTVSFWNEMDFSSIRPGTKRSDCAQLCYRSEVKPPSGRTGYEWVWRKFRDPVNENHSVPSFLWQWDKWINLIKNPSKVKLEGGDAPGSSGPNLVVKKKYYSILSFLCFLKNWRRCQCDSHWGNKSALSLQSEDLFMRWGHFYLVLRLWRREWWLPLGFKVRILGLGV